MLEDRLNNLEIKFTFQEDLLDQLNKVVTEQQFTIDKLVKQLKGLKSQMEEAGGASTILDNEKPPHY